MERGCLTESVRHFEEIFKGATSDADVMSWYGVALALAGVDRLRGVTLCEAAVRRSGRDVSADLLHNLGRAYLAVQYKKEAADALRRGASIQPDHQGIRATLKEMGVRRSPILPFLSRKNPVNKYLGLLRSRLSRRE